MLTPQEVTDKRFKQAFVGGYDMGAVDDFLEKLTEDYTKLFKENAVLKNKMKVLVDKLEEYRANDDALRQAFTAITAQAEQELEAAREERTRIIAEAHREFNVSSAELQERIAREEKRLAVTREQTSAFIDILKECYLRQIEQLTKIQSATMDDTPRQKHEKQVMAAAEQISAELASITAESAPDNPLPNSNPPDITASGSANGLPDSSPDGAAPSDAAGSFNASAELAFAPVRNAKAAVSGAEAPLPDSPTRNFPFGPADKEDGLSYLTSDEPTKPVSAPGAKEAPPEDGFSGAEDDLMFSIEQRLTAAFGGNDEVDWTPEEISEVKRPKFDFSSLDKNFGHAEDKKEGRGPFRSRTKGQS